MSRVEGLGTRAVFSRLPGQPVPREGASLEQVSAVGRLLYLGQAQVAQEGTYTCECSSVAGNSSQEQRLEVHGELGRDTWRRRPEGRATGHLAGRTHPRPRIRAKTETAMRTLRRHLLKVMGILLTVAPPISFLQRPPEHEQGGDMIPSSPRWPRVGETHLETETEVYAF